MKIIIPVAGRGTRLKPHTEKRQKCLLPVAGKPVLDHILEPLIIQGFDDIVLVCGHLDQQLRDYVKKFNAQISFVFQDKPLGLGHAVFQGLKSNEDPALIQLGDVIYDIDFRAFCRKGNHRIAINQVPDPERFGVVKIKNNQVVEVIEKPKNPPTNFAMVGLYFFSKQRPLWEAIKYLIDNEITSDSEIQLADALNLMVKSGENINVEYCNHWYDCGVPETLLSTNRELLKPSGENIVGSNILEPVYFGENTKIVNSTIGPNVTIMDDVTITNSIISDSIVLWKAKIDGKNLNGSIIEEGS